MPRVSLQCVLALLLAGGVPLGAEAGAPAVRLTGIVSWPARKYALFDLAKAGAGGGRSRPILQEGDRFPKPDLEVVAIDALASKVTVSLDGQLKILTLATADAPPSGVSLASRGTNRQPVVIHLQGAVCDQALEIYQELAGRTVLRSPGLPEGELDLHCERALPTAEAARALEGALAAKGLVIEPWGEKCVIAHPAGNQDLLDALPVAPTPSALELAAETRKDEISAGDIRFIDADVSQFLQVYQELSGRTMLRAPALPPGKVSVRTQTPLTRREATEMCDVLMALNGVSMVPQGDKFMFVVPTAELPKLTALLVRLAPAPYGQAGTMTPVALSRPAAEVQITAGAVNLAEAPLTAVIERYQALTGRVVEPAASVTSIRLSLRNQAPLTRGDLVYAFDMLLGLNQLALKRQSDSHFQLIPLAELDKNLNSSKP